MSKAPIKTIIIGVALSAALGFAAYRAFFFAVLVDVALVERGTVQEKVKGPGQVSSRTEVNVSSRIAGVVEQVLVQEGDRVDKGQLLVSLDGRELRAKASAARSVIAAAQNNIDAAEAALAHAQATRSLARSNLRRDNEVFEAGHLPKAAFEATQAAVRIADAAVKSAKAAMSARKDEKSRAGNEADYANTVLSHAAINAPIAGLVVKRQVEVGSTVAPGSTLLKVVDDKTVCVSTRVDVSQMAHMKVGLRADIRLASGKTARGTVARISHESDPVTRDQEVRVLFDEPPAHLTINEEADVVIKVGEAEGMVIDASALMPDGAADRVFVVKDGRAISVKVQVGAIDSGKAQILKGLAVGDPVIVNPVTAKTKPGQRVRPKIVAN